MQMQIKSGYQNEDKNSRSERQIYMQINEADGITT